MRFSNRILGLSASAVLVFSLVTVVPVFAEGPVPAAVTEWTGTVVYGSPTGSRYNSTDGFPPTNKVTNSSVENNVKSGITEISGVVTGNKWTLTGTTDLTGVKITVGTGTGDGTDSSPYTYNFTGKVDLEQEGGTYDGNSLKETLPPWKNWVDIYFTGTANPDINVFNSGNGSSTAMSVKLNGVEQMTGGEFNSGSDFYWATGKNNVVFDFDAAVNSSNGDKTFTVEIDPDGVAGEYAKRTFSLGLLRTRINKAKPRR